MTDQPTREQQLLHLADRARRGVALPAEHDALHRGINAMADALAEQRTTTVEALDASHVTLRRYRKRAEQADDLLRVAHETSNRSEAERARAVQRAEQAEADRDRVHERACRLAERLRKAERVQGRCPACGGAGLFLGSGGHVTCPRVDCPNPSGADELLHQRAHDWSSTEQPGPGPGGCGCGTYMRCPNGHCSRHYTCQDCGNCCSCECSGQPAENEARQLPCSLWLLSNGHPPHRWQPQPGMADVLCPGAPRKAAATQQQPTA